MVAGNKRMNAGVNRMKSNCGKSQRIPKLNARAYRGRVALYPATSSTGKEWFDLIFKKLLLGRVYGWKGNIGWGMVWAIVCFGGWYLTGSGRWFGVLTCAGLVKFIADVHEERADMKERMRERYGKYADEPYYGDVGAYGYGGRGSVYDGYAGAGGPGCSPNGFFGWEVPCAAAKADMEMMGFTFGKGE